MTTNLENLRAAAEQGSGAVAAMSDEFLMQTYRDAVQMSLDTIENGPFGSIDDSPETVKNWIRDLVVPIGFVAAFGNDPDKLAQTAMVIALAAYTKGYTDANDRE